MCLAREVSNKSSIEMREKLLNFGITFTAVFAATVLGRKLTDQPATPAPQDARAT